MVFGAHSHIQNQLFEQFFLFLSRYNHCTVLRTIIRQNKTKIEFYIRSDLNLADGIRIFESSRRMWCNKLHLQQFLPGKTNHRKGTQKYILILKYILFQLLNIHIFLIQKCTNIRCVFLRNLFFLPISRKTGS